MTDTPPNTPDLPDRDESDDILQARSGASGERGLPPLPRPGTGMVRMFELALGDAPGTPGVRDPLPSQVEQEADRFLGELGGVTRRIEKRESDRSPGVGNRAAHPPPPSEPPSKRTGPPPSYPHLPAAPPTADPPLSTGPPEDPPLPPTTFDDGDGGGGGDDPPDPEPENSGDGTRRNALLALTTRRPVAVMMVVVAICVFGWVSLDKLPLELMPRFSYPRLTIRTDYPTASPEVIEEQVSKPLEQGLGSVTDLVRKSSVSRAERSEVVLEFKWGTSMADASTEVRQRLDRVRMPTDAEAPLLLRYDPTLEPIVRYALAWPADAPDAPIDPLGRQMELRRIAEDVLAPELEKLDGVAAVTVLGGAEPHVHITATESRLAEHGLTLADIAAVLREQNVEQATGVIEEGKREFLVRAVNRFRSVEEISELQVLPGVPLSTVADIQLTQKDPEVRTRLDGQPSVEIELLKEADANIVEVSYTIWARLWGEQPVAAAGGEPRWEVMRRQRGRETDEAAAARATGVDRPDTDPDRRGRRGRWSMGETPDPETPLADLLPAGVRMQLLSDQSYFIEDSITEVWFAAIAGGALAVLVLFTFLRQLWRTLIVGLAIPVSVMATFTPMQLTDVTLNLMSFGGLALGLGMLVDNAIVVLESITRCREEGDGPLDAAVRGVSEVFGAIVASTLTTVAVFLPVVFVEGVAGQIFRHQALTVVFSLLVSLLVATFMIPVLAGLGIARGQARTDFGAMFRPSFVESGARWWRGITTGAAFAPLAALRGRRRSHASSDRVEQMPRGSWQHTSVAAGLSLTILRLALSPLVIVWCLAAIVLVGIELLLATVLEIVWRYLLLGLTILLLGSLWIILRELYHMAGIVLAPFAAAFDTGFDRLIAGYRWLLGASLRTPAIVLAGALTAACMTALVYPSLERELIPRLRQGEFTASFTLGEGMPLDRTGAALRVVEHALDEPGVRDTVERANLIIGEGRSGGGERVNGENLARLSVVMRRDAPAGSEERVKDAIRQAVGSSAELSAPEFTVPTLFTLSTPLEVEVRGQELDDIRDAAVRVERIVAAMPREPGADSALFDETRSSVRRGNPEILVRFDREALQRHDLEPASMADALRQALEGEVATDFTWGDRRIDVRVELSERDKPTIEAVRGLHISEGVVLEEVADFVHVEGPAEIRRRGNQRTAVVACVPVSGVALGTAAEQVRERLDAETFDGVIVRISGETEEMQQSLGSLFGALMLAVFLVYVVMAIQFESLIQPFIILLTVPLALFGVVLVLAVLGLPISIVVIVGVIVLAGIVVNNAIVLIDRINYNRDRGMPIEPAIIEAGTVRLRPIVITTLTTVLGLLPLTGWLPLSDVLHAIDPALATFGEGVEIRAPMAITVVVGLVASTVLTLVVIPVIYRVVAVLDWRRRKTDAPPGPPGPTAGASGVTG